MQHCFCDTSHELYLWLMFSCNIVCYTAHQGDYMENILALMDCIYLQCSHGSLFLVIPLTNCIYWWCSHAALFFWYLTRTVFIDDVLTQHCASDTSHELYLLMMFSWIIVFVIPLRNCIYWCFIMQHCVCYTSCELYLFVMLSCGIVFVIPLRNRIYWWCSHVALCLWYLSGTILIGDVFMQHCASDTSH